MLKPKIIVHCLVKNEERFIWYALQSVLPYVDKIMIWDTGSTDNTLRIIKSIKSEKISLSVIPSESASRGISVADSLTVERDSSTKLRSGRNDKEENFSAAQHTELRQQMLNETDKQKFTWLMILDGDEIWPKSQLEKTISCLKTTKSKVIVVKTKNLVGDIYHQLPESAGRYKIAEHKGHLNLRFINLSLPNLKIINPHGGQTYLSNNIALQDSKTVKVLPNIYYFHATHLERSSQDKQTLKRSFKRKFEIGEGVNKKDLPKIFFAPHPSIVPDVAQKMGLTTFIKSFIQTPIRRIKRKFIPQKSGY